MADWHALSKEKHSNSGWIPPTGYLQAKEDGLAPVVVAELVSLLPYYPFAFSKSPQGGFKLNVMLSLQKGRNLFVHDSGKWMVPYVPAAFRSYPFALMKNEFNNYVLAVDIESPFFVASIESESQRIFDEAGELMKPTAELVTFMQQRLAQQNQTDKLVAMLAKHQLIESWPIEVPETGNSSARKIVGYFRINEAALRELSDEALQDLVQSGAMGIAYAQLFSQARLKDLQARFVQYNQQTAGSPPLENVNLDKIFDGDSGDDLFSF